MGSSNGRNEIREADAREIKECLMEISRRMDNFLIKGQLTEKVPEPQYSRYGSSETCSLHQGEEKETACASSEKLKTKGGWTKMNYLTKEGTCPRYPLYIDSHAHVDRIMMKMKWKGTYSALLQRMVERGECSEFYQATVATFCDPEHFWITKRLQGERNLFTTYGIHPKKAKLFDIKLKQEIIERYDHDSKSRALGEVGLDFSMDCHEEQMNKQKGVFREILRVASRRDIPVVVHSRGAAEAVFEILKENLRREHRIHLHCWTQRGEIVKEIEEYFPRAQFGVTNLINLQGKKAQEARSNVQLIPMEKLLIESDAPYFPPQGKGIGHPGKLDLLIETIASLKGVSKREVMSTTAQNCKRLYGISGKDLQ